jgi:hypothetical protein
MSYSSIYGADVAPVQPSGRDAQLLGPSDNSDSGSDALGTSEAYGDSDAAGTGERGSVNPGDSREGADILPDHVVRLAEESEGAPEEDADTQDFTDLDASEPGESGDDEEAR